MQDDHELDRIVNGINGVAARIRALNEAGVPKARIASYLVVSPNHVYSTISRDRSRKKQLAPYIKNANGDSKVADRADRSEKELVMLHMTENGDLILPRAAVDRMKLGERAELAIFVSDGDLRVMTKEKALHRFRSGNASELASAASLAELLFGAAPAKS